MLFKPVYLWLTVFAIAATTICLGFEEVEMQNLPDETSLEAVDPVEDLNLLRFLAAEHRFKRARFGKSDPRSLFAAIYNNYPYAKRFSLTDFSYPAAGLSKDGMVKRGLRSPLDPRNLFRSVYGFKK